MKLSIRIVSQVGQADAGNSLGSSDLHAGTRSKTSEEPDASETALLHICPEETRSKAALSAHSD